MELELEDSLSEEKGDPERNAADCDCHHDELSERRRARHPKPRETENTRRSSYQNAQRGDLEYVSDELHLRRLTIELSGHINREATDW